MLNKMTYAALGSLMMMGALSSGAAADDRCAGRKPYLILRDACDRRAGLGDR